MTVRDHLPDAIGESDAFLNFQEQLSRVAGIERPVLLVGERGTGKELAARRLHYLSRRWNEPLVTLNCAALSSNLIESELFGYEPGAFTGARARRAGRFEGADGGTLFLDEIGLIPMVAQEKILRAVEYGAFERVGGNEALAVDVRIIGATHADLPALAAAGKFKPDLLDRLSFEVIHVPPLRVRGSDILILANYFASRMAAELGREAVPTFHPKAEAALLSYPWPGNVRELKNAVERAVYRADADEIREIVFDPFQQDQADATADALCLQEAACPAPAPTAVQPSPAPVSGSLDEAVRELEIRLLREALAACRYNQRSAAEVLGLSYHQFRGKYRKYQDELDEGSATRE